jgi:hypothetical protein
MEIRRAESDDDFGRYAEVWNAITPREHGYRELVTYTQEANEAMRAINGKLGYRERPAWVLVRQGV